MASSGNTASVSSHDSTVLSALTPNTARITIPKIGGSTLLTGEPERPAIVSKSDVSAQLRLKQSSTTPIVSLPYIANVVPTVYASSVLPSPYSATSQPVIQSTTSVFTASTNTASNPVQPGM
eukprot:TRINITY_DN29_c0_g3_i2.p1 TRINITY_DN29_c0_g3~~TRINITY_DN29_c0_g3_i2.p1  ORF type:complete len:122 (+),score=5.57 TRINITY_DN29_c0_g3_i2:1130-1495(+)